MTENINEAQRYADSIAEGLDAWQVAAEYVAALAAGEADDEVTGDALDITEWAPLNGYEGDVVDAAAAIAREDLLECDTIEGAWDIYVGTALCVELTGKNDGGGWTVTGAEVTVTSGGPSAWIEWDGSREYVTVRCAWGSDRGNRYAIATGLCAALDSIAAVGA